LITVLIFANQLYAQDSAYKQQELIYGRKDGMALTLIHIQPRVTANKKAIIKLVSGNWISGNTHLAYYTESAMPLLKRGYTVFLIMHGSQPRYAIPDQVADVKRATRFIRYNAAKFNIDPDHLGITGSSSGGNLSLLVATADESRDTSAKDPIDRVSARVQAAAVFYPPTDFLNWGQPGLSIASNPAMLRLARVSGAFEFTHWNERQTLYELVTDSIKKNNLYKDVSPITSVSKDDPPVLIIHGDKDKVVPLQQSQALVARLTEAGVRNQLIIKKDGAHGWKDQQVETELFADWFDKYLR
jgi:acetyl esterase/lipase